MSFNWREFLVIAHQLRLDAGEGIQRTCLGRIYYYVYNTGLSKALSSGLAIQAGRGRHRQLWDWFRGHPDPAFKQMGLLGNRIYSRRIDADYKAAPMPNLALEVIGQFSRARQFEELIAGIDGQPPPPALMP